MHRRGWQTAPNWLRSEHQREHALVLALYAAGMIAIAIHGCGRAAFGLRITVRMVRSCAGAFVR